MKDDQEKIHILFMQSQKEIYADTNIHSLLVKNLNRDKFEVHVVVNDIRLNEKKTAIDVFESISDVHLYPMSFGPSLHNDTESAKFPGNLWGSFELFINLFRLFRYARKNKIQIIHSGEKPRDAFYGYLIARATGAKLLIHLHIKMENWVSPISRWVIGHSDKIVGVSGFVAESARTFGYSERKIRTIHNGLDLSKWDFKIDGDQARARFNIGDKTPLITAIGRLVYYKGQLELIKAMSVIKEQNQDFSLIFLGEGDQEPGGYVSKLKSLVEDSGLEKQIIFAGHRSDVQEILASCDFFALPSFEEPFGMVFIEAMAMKKAVVALASGGAEEIVEHGKSGLLSQPNNINALADNIMKLLSCPDMRMQMGEYGRTRVEKMFRVERMTCDFEDLYRGLIAT